MTTYSIETARLVPTMCHRKLPTPIMTLLTLSNFRYHAHNQHISLHLVVT